MAKNKQTKKNPKKSNKKRLGIALGISIPVVVAGATTGIVFGVKSCNSKTVDREVEVDDTSKTAGIKISSTTTASGDVEISLTSDETCGKKVEDITEITIGNTKLNKDDYTFDKATGKVTIKKEVLDKNPGKIVVTPTLGDKTVTGISLSVTSQTVKTGGSFKIKATGKYATNEQVTWTCDSNYLVINPDTSALGDEVTVTAKKEAVESTTVKATYGTHEATCTVKIVEKTVTGITIDQKHTSIEVDEEKDIAATITENTSNTNLITWAQSSTDGGKVSFDGSTERSSESGKTVKLKGVTKGNVTITAKAGEKSDSFTLAVTEPTVVITKFALGTDIKSAFTNPVINSKSVSESSPNVSFTVSLKDKTADVEGHFVIYKTKGTPLGTLTKEKLTKGTEIINRTIPVSTWTGLTSSDTLTVDWVDESEVESITVSGNHNATISDYSTMTYTVTDQYGNDVTDDCTFASSDSTIGTFKDEKPNVLKLTSDGQTKGGSLTITATYSPANGNAITNDFAIEIATFDKLLADGTDYSLQKGYAKQADASISGAIVTPTRYWDKDLSAADKWVATTGIYGGGFNNDGITSIYVSSTIGSIGSQPFGKGLTSIVVNPNNTIYKSTGNVGGTEKECNAIMSLDGTILLFGCTNTIIPDDGTLTIIESNAFLNSSITNVSIPASITSIGNQAFYNCESLTSVTFAGTSSCSIIKQGAFQYCTLLGPVTIPDSVQTIEKLAFAYCSDQLNKVILPNSSKWIQTGDSEKKQLNTTDTTANATNLKQYSSAKDNNWGYTGIEVYASAVKSATVTYDSTFSTNNIAVNDYTSSVLQSTTDTIAIKTTNNGSEAISGKIIFKNNTSTEIGSIDVTYTAGQERTTDSITLDATAWGKINPQDTITASFVATKEITITGSDSINQTESATYTAMFGATEVECDWTLKETITDESVVLDGSKLTIQQWSDPAKTYTLVATPKDSQYAVAEKQISINACGPRVTFHNDNPRVSDFRWGDSTGPCISGFNYKQGDEIILHTYCYYLNENSTEIKYTSEGVTTALEYGEDKDFEASGSASQGWIKLHIKSITELKSTDSMLIHTDEGEGTTVDVEYDSDSSFENAGITINKDTSTKQWQDAISKRTLTMNYECSGEVTGNVIITTDPLQDAIVYKEEGVTFTPDKTSMELQLTNRTNYLSANGLYVIFEQTETTSFTIDSNGLVSMTDDTKAQEADVIVPAKINGITVKGFANNGCAGSKATSIVCSDSDSITTIGASAFAGSAITFFDFSKHITKISDLAFSECKSLQEIDWYSCLVLTEVGNGVFKNCSALTQFGLDLVIQPCITKIGAEVFVGTAIAGIQFGNVEHWYQIGGTEEVTIETIEYDKNAANFKNTDAGITGTNWGTTGLVRKS